MKRIKAVIDKSAHDSRIETPEDLERARMTAVGVIMRARAWILLVVDATSTPGESRVSANSVGDDDDIDNLKIGYKNLIAHKGESNDEENRGDAGSGRGANTQVH